MPQDDQRGANERDEQMDQDGDQDGEANLVLELTIEPSQESLEQLFGVDEEQLAEVAAATIARLQIEDLVKISVLLTDDDNLRMLNREYRHQDKATDVLSFPAQDAPIVSAPGDQLWQASEGDFEDDDHVAGANGATPQAQQAASAVDADAEQIGDDLDEDDELFEDFDEDVDELDEDALDLGDIAISYDAVKRQAGQAGHSSAWEFCYLLVHGILHLAGYDDQSEAGYNAMVKLQDEILAEVNISK